jgi:hypothetical protein
MCLKKNRMPRMESIKRPSLKSQIGNIWSSNH